MSYYDILLAKQLSGGGGGITPTGSLSITENDTYDVTQYASAVVNVPNPSTGIKSITENGTYDVAAFAEADVNVSGGPIIVGALRPDAELWKHYTYDKLLVQDEGVTIPAYSTSSTTLVSNTDIETLTLDRESYCYFYVSRTLIIPVYDNNNPVKGRQEYFFSSCTAEYSAIFNKMYKSLIGTPAGVPANGSITEEKRTAGGLVYWWTATTIDWSNGYNQGGGVWWDEYGPNFTAGNLKIRTSPIRIKGSSTTLTSAVWDTLTDIRVQYVIDVYRVPVADADVIGFNSTSNRMKIANCVNNGGTLT